MARRHDSDDTVTAYQDLREALEELADNLRTVHSNDDEYAVSVTEGDLTGDLKEYRHQFVSTLYKCEHPAARVHPRDRRAGPVPSATSPSASPTSAARTSTCCSTCSSSG